MLIKRSVVQPHAAITKERVDKALSSLYLTAADTNVFNIRVKERCAVRSLGRLSLPPHLDAAGCSIVRPSFASVVPGADFAPAAVGCHLSPSWSTHWLRLELQVPAEWRPRAAAGWTIQLQIDCGCEAALYGEDGSYLQGLTGGDADSYRGNRRAEYVLPPSAAQYVDVQTFFVEVACNGLFGVGASGMINAPDPDRTFCLATCELQLVDPVAEKLFWHYVVLRDLVEYAPPGSLLAERALLVANAVLNVVSPHDRDSATEAIAMVEREVLVPVAAGGSFGAPVIEPCWHHPLDALVCCVGHCHIDSAWLWPFAESRRKVARSWASQLSYMRDLDVGFTFTASQALHYMWLKQDQPGLFDAALRPAVAAGRFIPVGGSLVEPDCNMPSGEALVRQFLLGTAFFAGHLQKEIIAAERKSGGGAARSCAAPAAAYRIPHGDATFFLPDTFGYCAQLPQIMRLCGLRYFLTQKLSWSLLNKPVHNTFWWKGLDGSCVLTHFPPADDYNAQADVAAVLKSANGNKDRGRVGLSLMLYGNGDGGGGPTPAMLQQLWRLGAMPADGTGCSRPVACAASDSAVPAIISDSSGLAAGSRTQYAPMPGMPRLQHSSPRRFFDALLTASSRQPWGLTTWDGELYLELHQGTLTSQAGVKRGNRTSEVALHNAEAACAIAVVAAPAAAYSRDRRWQQRLARAWLDVLLCAFHDVLPGSSIAQVYTDAAAMHAGVLCTTRDVLDQALRVIETNQGGFDGSSEAESVLWNLCPFPRQELVELQKGILTPVYLPAYSKSVASVSHTLDRLSGALSSGLAQHLTVVAALLTAKSVVPTLLCVTDSVMPAVPLPGRVSVFSAIRHSFGEHCVDAVVVDNGIFRLTFDAASGQLLSLLDFRRDSARPREVIRSSVTTRATGPCREELRLLGGNSIVCASDVPFFWDAWDVMPYALEKVYVQGMVAATPACEPSAKDGAATAANCQISILEGGPLRARIRITLPQVGLGLPALPTSWMQQDVIITADDPLVVFDTAVQWHESHTLLKVEFPFDLRAATAVYEIQFGVVERPTHTNTPRDMMQFEVCGHRWADLSAHDYGCALLNNCKYGYSCRDGVLALSLLRSPKSPDPLCDMGTHHFCYGLLPHWGHVRSASAGSEVLARAAAFNNPTRVAWSISAHTAGASDEAIASESSSSTHAVPTQHNRALSSGMSMSVASHSFFSVTLPDGVTPCGHVVLDTVKVPASPHDTRGEEEEEEFVGYSTPFGPDALVMRFYEALGLQSNAVVHVAIPAASAAGSELRRIERVTATNLLEEPLDSQGILVPGSSPSLPTRSEAAPVASSRSGGAGILRGAADASLLLHAPPAVFSAFSTVGGPFAPTCVGIRHDGVSFEMAMAPFQIATFMVYLAPRANRVVSSTT